MNLDILHKCDIFKAFAASIPGNVNVYIDTPRDRDRAVLFGKISLVADATVANRYIVLYIVDETHTIVTALCTTTATTASTTGYLYIYPETPSTATGNRLSIQQPLVLPAGYGLRISVEGGVAGDVLGYSIVFADLNREVNKVSGRRNS